MKWGLTGSPGTGKTSAARKLKEEIRVVHLHELVTQPRFRAGYDEERDTVIADIDGLSEWLEEQNGPMLVESHLAHLLPVDGVIVLRCHPEDLAERLASRDATSSPDKLVENVEAERLDLILSTAVERRGIDAVFEIDTTDRDPQDVAKEVHAVLAGDRDPSQGAVSFLSDP